MVIWSGWNLNDPLSSDALGEVRRLGGGAVDRLIKSDYDKPVPCKAHRNAPPEQGPFDTQCSDCMRRAWRWLAGLHHEALWSLMHTMNGMAMQNRDAEAVIDKLRASLAEKSASNYEQGTRTIERLAIERDEWRRRALAAEAVQRTTATDDGMPKRADR
jgi:hypothetical protein